MGMTHREFDKESGVAKVVIVDQFGVAEGRAGTHEDDRDLMSEITGLTIAELRARIKRETTRKNESHKEMLRAISRVETQSKHYFGRVAKLEELENQLESYLENKELFRKRYRKINSGESTRVPKMK